MPYTILTCGDMIESQGKNCYSSLLDGKLYSLIPFSYVCNLKNKITTEDACDLLNIKKCNPETIEIIKNIINNPTDELKKMIASFTEPGLETSEILFNLEKTKIMAGFSESKHRRRYKAITRLLLEVQQASKPVDKVSYLEYMNKIKEDVGEEPMVNFSTKQARNNISMSTMLKKKEGSAGNRSHINISKYYKKLIEERETLPISSYNFCILDLMYGVNKTYNINNELIPLAKLPASEILNIRSYKKDYKISGMYKYLYDQPEIKKAIENLSISRIDDMVYKHISRSPKEKILNMVKKMSENKNLIVERNTHLEDEHKITEETIDAVVKNISEASPRYFKVSKIQRLKIQINKHKRSFMNTLISAFEPISRLSSNIISNISDAIIKVCIEIKRGTIEIFNRLTRFVNSIFKWIKESFISVYDYTYDLLS